MPDGQDPDYKVGAAVTPETILCTKWGATILLSAPIGTVSDGGGARSKASADLVQGRKKCRLRSCITLLVVLVRGALLLVAIVLMVLSG